MNSNLPSITASSLIAKIRTYKGTRWHHAGRAPGVGLDCSGMISCALRELGVPIHDIVNYTMLDEYKLMVDTISEYFDRVETQIQLGDIYLFRGLLFKGREITNHLGIVSEITPRTIIHACNDVTLPFVKEEALRPKWAAIIDSVWRYKEII